MWTRVRLYPESTDPHTSPAVSCICAGDQHSRISHRKPSGKLSVARPNLSRHNADGAAYPLPAPRSHMDMLQHPVLATLLQYLDASDQGSVVVAWVAPWIGLTRSRAERRRSNQRRADRFHALRRRWGRPPSTPSSESSVE